MSAEWAPIATLFAAFIGAAITYFVVVKRKKLMFTVLEPWRQNEPHSPEASRKHPTEEIADQQTEVTVRCKGNATINDVVFEVVPDGKVTRTEVEVAQSGYPQLEHSVETNWATMHDTNASQLRCRVPFLNPGEFLRLHLRWHGNGEDVRVYCRLEEVDVDIRTDRYWDLSPPSYAAVRDNLRRMGREYQRTGSIRQALSHKLRSRKTEPSC
jgi:hypothetical protein